MITNPFSSYKRTTSITTGNYKSFFISDLSLSKRANSIISMRAEAPTIHLAAPVFS
jgi:hypothetical protein